MCCWNFKKCKMAQSISDRLKGLRFCDIISSLENPDNCNIEVL